MSTTSVVPSWRSVSRAQVTASFDDVLADDSVDAVVVATPVPTHHELARRTLEAGKHVFVEKPPAMRGAEMEELCELAEERGRVLMPGHLLLYHPAVQKLKEIVDSGELGDVLCVYGNRQNLGTIRTHENALWSLGVHDLSVLLYLIGEEPASCGRTGNAFLNQGRRGIVFCYLRFPSGKIAHMHLSGWTHTRSGESPSSAATRWRCSTTWSPSARSRCTTRRLKSRRRPTASGAPARGHPQPEGAAATSRCDSSASTS